MEAERKEGGESEMEKAQEKKRIDKEAIERRLTGQSSRDVPE